jgi:hypothetical protein
MVFTFVFGTVAITFLLGMLKVVIRLEDGLVLAFAFLGFLIMLTLEAVFIRLLLRRGRGAEAGDTGRLTAQTTRELNAGHAGVLPEPIPSVTEHTTRAFDPIHSERKPKSQNNG